MIGTLAQIEAALVKLLHVGPEGAERPAELDDDAGLDLSARGEDAGAR